MRGRQNSLRVPLLCGLVWSVLAVANEDGAAAWRTHSQVGEPDPAHRAEGNSAFRSCFDEANGESSTRQEANSLSNLPTYYRNWLSEDVSEIITPAERCAFLHLASNQEREQFIEQFWYRRAQEPESLENEFKEEHYRRIVSANEKFGTETPGWKTDRGRAYIRFGPPDSIESYPIGQQAWTRFEDDLSDGKYSWEKWHYRYLEGLGKNVECTFVDLEGTGNYHLRLSPQDKDRLFFVPGFSVEGVPSSGANPEVRHELDLYIGPQPTGLVKFKDLEAVVTSGIIRDQVHFSHRIDYSKATDASTVADILVDIPSGQMRPSVKVQPEESGYEVFGRVTRPTGGVVYTFERSSGMDRQQKSDQPNRSEQVTVALEPGPYQLAIVVKDIASGNVGVTHKTLEVPSYEELVAAKKEH